MSVIGTAPVRSNAACVSSPGTLVTSTEPGLKPSARFWSLTSIGLPATLRGTEAASSATRRPVAVDGSATVNASLGHGYRHSAASSGSHARCGWSALAAGATAAAASVTSAMAIVLPRPIAPGCNSGRRARARVH